MSRESWESLLDHDWSTEWESLPEAPAVVPRRKSAQVTLRLPASLLRRVKQVAAARSLPYHAMVRSWITTELRKPMWTRGSANLDEPLTEQLNLKFDQDVLDELKARANELRRPYHRLAREWVEASVALEEARLGIEPAGLQLPAIKDLMVLLLHAPSRGGEDAVRGVTRLQKLLFVLEQKLASQSTRFYAYNFGPFSEEVNDAADALKLAGFLRGGYPATVGAPSFAEMASTVVERSGPRDRAEAEVFGLNEQGHRAAEHLRQSGAAYEQLYQYVRAIRTEWDTPELVERVYEEFPDYAEKSLIRGQVERRRAMRRSR
ncbi:MAG TPA: CopG family antitoxin [Acidimicrobiales bacterium]|nr:CopG family antitoxin [Acidimicrobiales bacterium]